jgi:hypothetical protein
MDSDNESPIEQRAREIAELRGERAVLAGILVDCAAVIKTIEPESTEEAENLDGLLRAIAYAIDPYRHKGPLL